MIRALVVDDSATSRLLLKTMLESDPTLTVVGQARSGEEAVRLAGELRPDVITMDVQMPGINGYEATRRIMAQSPTPIVIVSAGAAGGQLDVTFNALQAGALNVVPKPVGPDHPDYRRCRDQLVATVKLMSVVKAGGRFRPPPPVASVSPPLPRRKLSLVAIGASTGGPAALGTVVKALPPGFAPTLLIVQHIAPGFVEGLVAWLQHQAALPVRIAADGETIAPGTIYVAGDDRHLVLQAPKRLGCMDGPPISSVRPSITALFQSVAEQAGAEAAGVLLTGMGADGAAGLLKLRQAGGLTLVQDEATCVVSSMPLSAVRLGAAERVLPLEAIGPALAELDGGVAVPDDPS